MEKEDLQNLKKRYLIWLYKTTKDSFDRIERKFTQIEIDRMLLKELKHLDAGKKCSKSINDFLVYVQNKEKDGLNLKFEGKALKPEYLFLEIKLKAIEKIIVKELGSEVLREIKSLYEEEMVERILKSTEH